MATKALDQVGHAGVFHHIIRRKAVVPDTGLNNLKDVQAKVLYLPLMGDGVFGKGLEENLKKRKEQKEQLYDLVTDFTASKADSMHKQKLPYDSGSWNSKHPFTERNFGRNFIPKYPVSQPSSKFSEDRKSSYDFKGKSNKDK